MSVQPFENEQSAGDIFAQSECVTCPEQASVHVQPSSSRQSKSNERLAHAAAVPVQRAFDVDHEQPCCFTQLRASFMESQSDAEPEQALESAHPGCSTQSS